ncbi:c-type cytochrome [Bordetella genomosp. 5]|uniref:c-type cytochrome n=1 Tax=Bordetella genomosp. 5 TaxID=1395608 RepID=UPI001C3E37D6|nr:cytochrome c [Bordetella genomosp. 5]
MSTMLRRLFQTSCLMLAFAGTAPTQAAQTSPAAATRHAPTTGEYLSIASDCVACHTVPGGKPYAGSYAIESPMGKIWSTNITPSREFGIGDYSLAEFSRAVREGVARDGHHLYPAMPYTAYATMTDADVEALYTFFMKEVQPVDTPTPKTALPFPFSVRDSMIVWNAINRPSGPFKADPAKSAEINRGDYLVNTLAHCAACHTPRDFLLAEDGGKALSGGPLGAWYAPNITSDPVSGIGGWSDAELYAYLRTGHVAGKAQAAGPMAEAIEHSLQHLTEPDLHAIVAYLKQTRPIAGGETRPRYAFGGPDDSEARERGKHVRDMDPGWRVYSATCATCHGARGEGTASYPSLFHNTATGAPDASNLIATILYGVHRKIDGHEDISMPGFGPQASYTERLSDQQIADVSNYVLAHYGQAGNRITPQDVELARNGGPEPALIRFTRIALPVGGVVAVLLLIAIVYLVARRRAKKA